MVSGGYTKKWGIIGTTKNKLEPVMCRNILEPIEGNNKSVSVEGMRISRNQFKKSIMFGRGGPTTIVFSSQQQESTPGHVHIWKMP